MKLLGWFLLLSLSQAHAQQVIESAPLSITEEGTRKIIERADGDKDAKPAEIPHDVEVVAPPAAEALVIPNDDVVNPPVEKKTAKSKKKSKLISKEANKDAAKTVEPSEAIPAIAPIESAPVVKKDAPANPIDGQLKLGPSTETPPTAAPVVKDGEIRLDDNKKAPTFENDVIAIAIYDNTLRRYLQFSFGYLNSNYEKFHPSLDNGSMLTSFRFVGDMTTKIQTGFAVEIISDRSNQNIPDVIRALQYRLFADYHEPLFQKGAVKTDWIGSMAFSIGDYGVRRRYLNSQGQELSTKIKEGTLVGLIPGAGIRIYLVGKSSFDLMVEYHLYFGKTQTYIGGLAFNPRLSFEF